MLSKSQLQTQLQNQLQSCLQTERQTVQETQQATQPQTETETHAKSEMCTHLETQAQTDQQTQLQVQVETQTETQQKIAELETQQETEAETQHEIAEPETQHENETETHQETEPEAQHETESEIQHETEPEIQHEIAEQETQHETEPEIQHEIAEQETQYETESEIQHEIAEPETQHETDPEIQHEIAEPETQHETEPEIQHEIAEQETQNETEPEIQHEIAEPETQHETEPEIQHEIAEQETQNETQPEIQHEIAEPETQHETEAEIQHETEPETQHETELETQHENDESEIQHETEPETQHENDEPETQHETEAEIQHETEQETQHETEAEIQHETEPETQHETEPEIQRETESDTQHDTEPETQHENAEPETQQEIQHEIEGETQLEIQQYAQSEYQQETQPETQPELHVQPQTEPETQPQDQHELDQQYFYTVDPGTILATHAPRPATVQRPTAPVRPPVLHLPYPVEQCGAELQRAFPGQIGRFYVTSAYSYAYACNRMSIEMAAESMGFDKRSLVEALRPALATAQQQEFDGGRSPEMEKLERDLASDPRLTLMILKPAQMRWDKLGNCLLFERCHPQRRFIADKWQMFLVLRSSSSARHLQLATASGKKFDFNQFILFTTNPGSNQKDLIHYLDAHPGTYILKRTDYSQGIGIKIYHAEMPNTVDKLRRCIGDRARLRQFVMQKYIERPLLVDKRKFDLRVYMMLLSCKRPAADGTGGFENSYFAFCFPGYVKLSCYPYSQMSRDLHVHLTNQFVQKQRRSMYTRVKEATTWFPDELSDYLNRRGRAEADWCQKRLYGRIRTIIGYVAAAFRPHLDSTSSPASVFRLYGPDFIIDEELRVWLLEVNTFPSYAKNTTALSGSIRNMWREAVTLATEVTLRYRNRLPVEGLTTMRNFRMAYSSEDPLMLAELVRQNFA